MEFVPVESSNVEAIGYDSAARLLRIKYRDGRTYEHDDVSPLLHAALMDAPSKGRFVHRHLSKGVECLTVAGLQDALNTLEPGSVIPLRDATLNTFEPDDCCIDKLVAAAREGKAGDSWTCPKCGCEWKPRTVGNVRHWEPQSDVMVFNV